MMSCRDSTHARSRNNRSVHALFLTSCIHRKLSSLCYLLTSVHCASTSHAGGSVLAKRSNGSKSSIPAVTVRHAGWSPFNDDHVTTGRYSRHHSRLVAKCLLVDLHIGRRYQQQPTYRHRTPLQTARSSNPSIRTHAIRRVRWLTRAATW